MIHFSSVCAFFFILDPFLITTSLKRDLRILEASNNQTFFGFYSQTQAVI